MKSVAKRTGGRDKTHHAQKKNIPDSDTCTINLHLRSEEARHFAGGITRPPRVGIEPTGPEVEKVLTLAPTNIDGRSLSPAKTRSVNESELSVSELFCVIITTSFALTQTETM